MRGKLRGRAFHAVLSVLWAAGFFLPALRRAPGAWPVPLDDVYIHFDFAKSLAGGHPMHWIAGQGYSSGETAPLYAAVLAVGYLLGFRGPWLNVVSVLLGLVSAYAMMRCVHRMLRPAGRTTSLVAPCVLSCTGYLGWSWWSGMELAVFGAFLAFCVGEVASLQDAPGRVRRRQVAMRLGMGCAALVLLRPEALVFCAAFGVSLLVQASSTPVWGLGLRAGGPPALATLAVGTCHYAFTGSFQAAGAQLKLLSHNPYLSPFERTKDVLTNMAMFKWRVLDLMLVTPRAALFIPLSLGILALRSFRTRVVALPALVGAGLFALLVSYNGAARYQNYRYYVPAALLVYMVALLGLCAIPRALRWVRGVVLFAWCTTALAAAPAQVQFFADAAANITEQHVQVAAYLREHTPKSAILLVGDAGALPYLSDRHAVDALGLGGYRSFPFVRAAPHGEAAMLEMMEHVPKALQPTHLVLYDNWFPTTAAKFGRRMWSRTIEHNVICGGATKGVYEANWGPLRAAGSPPEGRGGGAEVLFEVDVADVLSEARASYASLGCPLGFTAAELAKVTAADVDPIFDGGRRLAPGCAEAFTLPQLPGVLYTRFLGDDDALRVEGAITSEVEPKRCSDCFRVLRSQVAGGAVVVRAKGYVTVNHHWLLRAP